MFRSLVQGGHKKFCLSHHHLIKSITKQNFSLKAIHVYAYQTCYGSVSAIFVWMYMVYIMLITHMTLQSPGLSSHYTWHCSLLRLQSPVSWKSPLARNTPPHHKCSVARYLEKFQPNHHINTKIKVVLKNI